MLPKKFFIIGCQRSGTTLLKLILESHSQIICMDEPHSYQLLNDQKGLEKVLITTKGKNWYGFKIPRFTEQLSRQVVYDYGIRGISKPYSNFYQQEPLFFIVRDVRDVICSMKELGANNRPWIRNSGEPVIRYWLENSEDFRKKFETEIFKVEQAKFSDLALMALYWKYKNYSYFEYKDKFPILMIKYEELVNDPREVTETITSFLDVKWEESLLKHHTLPHETNAQGFAKGQTDPSKPISSIHVGRYQEELTKEEMNDIDSISGDLMKLFGYST